MLLITVQLISARTGKLTTLHRGVISNDGTGTAESGNYTAWLGNKGSDTGGAGKSVRVDGFPRRRQSAWRLLYKVLKEAYDRS